MSVWKKVASAAGKATGSYLAVGSRSPTYGVTLLDHTTPGSLSYADFYYFGSDVSDVDFTPDGNYLALSANQITLLDHTFPGLLAVASTYSQSMNGQLNFSPDGNYLVCAVLLQGVVLYDHTTPGSLSLAATYATPLVSFAPRPESAAFSPDGNYIVVGPSMSTITLLDHTTPGSLSLAATYTALASADNVEFSPDGNYITVPCFDANGTVTLLDHTTPGSLSLAATYALGTSGLRDAAFNDTGDYIAVATSGDVLLLDHTTPGSLSLATTYTLNTYSYRVDFTPDGKYLAAGGGNYVTLLDHTTPGSLSFAATYNVLVEGLDFSPPIYPPMPDTTVYTATWSQSSVYDVYPGMEAMDQTAATNDNAYESTKTGTNNGTNEYVKADLGAIKPVRKVVVGYASTNSPSPGSWNENNTGGAVVEYSTDDSSWTTFATLPLWQDFPSLYVDSRRLPVTVTPPVNARYVRIRKPSGRLAVTEFKISNR